MKRKLKQNIILLIIAIFIFALFLEIGARIVAHFSSKFFCSTYSNLEDSFLCLQGPDLMKSLEKNNIVIRTKEETCDKWDAELGWVTKQNCRTLKYSTNSQGFRGTKEYDLEKNKTRIIIVGDSFTWGENNSDNETYPYYLDKMFNESVDIINMGVRGYGPDQFYLYFMREGLKYKPDIVLFGLFLPDIHRSIFRFRYYFKPRFIIKNEKLELDPTSKQIPDLRAALTMSSYIKEKNRIYSVSYLLGSFNKLIRLATAYEEETTLTLKIIEEMNSQLKRDNIKLIVLLIPEQEMVEKGNTNYYGVVPKITSRLKEMGIDYINLQPVFKKEYELTKNSLYQGHLKPIGNIAVANESFNYLTKNVH